jgi:polyisoprenoid-binding protein YceI
MRSLGFLLAALFAAAPLACPRAALDPGQIDPSHSTARFSLTSSSGSTRPFELAVAMVAGTLNANPSKPRDAGGSLVIFPAGQDSLLLTREGTLRTGTLAPLSSYSVLEFQSERSFPAPNGRLAIVGELTLIHVKRRVNVDWSNSYTGPIYEDPIETRVNGEATFFFDRSASIPANGPAASADLISGETVINRANFPGLWSALRDSEWPNVVLDEICRTPYYPGPGLKDYKGATCVGRPVGVAPRDVPQVTPPGIEAIGTIVPVPPTGDQVVVHVQLRIIRDGPHSTGKAGI